MDDSVMTELNRLRMMAGKLDSLEPDINYLALVVGDWVQKGMAEKEPEIHNKNADQYVKDLCTCKYELCKKYGIDEKIPDSTFFKILDFRLEQIKNYKGLVEALIHDLSEADEKKNQIPQNEFINLLNRVAYGDHVSLSDTCLKAQDGNLETLDRLNVEPPISGVKQQFPLEGEE